jgi:hypothetical protein
MSGVPKSEAHKYMIAAEARRKALAEWRRIDLTAQEVALANKTKSIKDVVNQVVSGIHLERRRGDAEVLKAWSQLVDPNIAAHAQPVNLHKGTLFIAVDSSTWLSEIVRYRRKEILDRIQHCFGKELVTKLSFRAG